MANDVNNNSIDMGTATFEKIFKFYYILFLNLSKLKISSFVPF